MIEEQGKLLDPGDIVQIAAETANPAFAFCLMVVEEVKPWGVQGYVQALGTRDGQGGMAYYRASWDEIEATGGKAVWRVEFGVPPAPG
jgi:hypothetical protein